jgi:hypothetical protein
MSRALIHHIGYHRTGTTTLQELVFPQLRNVTYYYKDRTPAAKPIVHAFGRSPDIWRRLGEKFFSQLRSSIRERGADGSALISSESMSVHNIFTPLGGLGRRGQPKNHRDQFLLAAHLRECRAAARLAGFDELKVIFGIRRQDQYLASYYAKQGSMTAGMPGQADFERQTLEIIDPDKRYFVDGIWLDYKLTRDLLAKAIGGDNVLVLPLEQLGDEPSRYVSGLYAFVDEPLDLDGTILERTNFRSVAPDSWQIKQAAMKKALRRKSFGRIRAMMARAADIHMPPELREEILETYRSSNQQLAICLGIDLAQYGYCGVARGADQKRAVTSARS